MNAGEIAPVSNVKMQRRSVLIIIIIKELSEKQMGK